jgi:hypothetical protein
MPRTHETCATFVLAGAVLIWPLGACSRDAPASGRTGRGGDATKVSGCELITAVEIQEVTGLVAGKSDEGSGLIRDCNWSTADGRPLIGMVVGAAPRTYDEYLENVREQMGPDSEKLEMGRVTDLGTYAIWHGAGYLNAAQGSDLLVIWIFAEPAGGKAKRDAAIELARKALPRLLPVTQGAVADPATRPVQGHS